MCLQYESFKNTVGKEEIASSVFYSWRPFCHFDQMKVVICKLFQFADDNFKFDETGREFSIRVKNTVGKGTIADYEQHLLFPLCFQKTCTADTSKPGLVSDRVKR